MSVLPFIETVINPEDYPPMRIPDHHAGVTAVFKTPMIVDLPFSGIWDATSATSAVLDGNPEDGYSEVILVPGSSACYLVTLGETVVVWDADAKEADFFDDGWVPILSTHPVSTDIVGGVTYLSQGLRSTGTNSKSVAVLPKQDVSGIPWFECSLQPLGDADDRLHFFVGFNNASVLAPVRTVAYVTMVWSEGSVETIEHNIVSYGFSSSSHVGYYVFDFLIPTDSATVVRFSVSVKDIDPSSHWRFSLTRMNDLSTTTYGFTLTNNSACAFRIYDAPEMDALAETLSERTSALSGLITYMGSTLADGGQISAARLGLGLSPLRAPSGDTYKFLASLPFYNGDFAMREGIYVWWLPDSSQESFYVPYRRPRSDDLEATSVLQIALHRDDPNQAIRLKIVQDLEVITRSRLYASDASPTNVSYAPVLGLAKSLPAVTINSKHVGILGRAFGKLKGWLSSGANWRKLLRTGASLVSALAPGSRPAVVARTISQFV
jgi:hypothetical protein